MARTVDELIVEINRKLFAQDNASIGAGIDRHSTKIAFVDWFEDDKVVARGTGNNLGEAIRDLAQKLGIQ